jgi:hypothetical protein
MKDKRFDKAFNTTFKAPKRFLFLEEREKELKIEISF